jgi:hypothetical protein
MAVGCIGITIDRIGRIRPNVVRARIVLPSVAKGGLITVIRLTRHARGLLVALAALALTAGAAVAARPTSAPSMPDAASTGLERASEVSGKTVPVGAPAAGADEDEDTGADQEEPAENEPAEDAAGEHPDNHGAAVSAAAQGATPEAFDNHGQYVRSVATVNHGHDESAERGNSEGKGNKPTP